MDGLWIYFLAVDGSLIKIGKSRQGRGARLEQHRAPALDGHVPVVEPICEVRAASGADESAVHRFFDRHRVRGEVFRADVEIIDYLRWLRDEHYVSVPEDSDAERESLPVMDPEVWLPKAGRSKPRDSSVLPGMFPPFDLGPRLVTMDDYYTNQVIIEAARLAMGAIDLDPATHAVANRVVQASRFFTLATNGLTQPWGGRVWLNPPFSEWKDWAHKILAELERGEIQALCTFVATQTITSGYFRNLLSRSDSLAVISKRWKLWGKRAGHNLNDGHCVLYFGPDSLRFRQAFSEIAVVFHGSSERDRQTVAPQQVHDAVLGPDVPRLEAERMPREREGGL